MRSNIFYHNQELNNMQLKFVSLIMTHPLLGLYFSVVKIGQFFKKKKPVKKEETKVEKEVGRPDWNPLEPSESTPRANATATESKPPIDNDNNESLLLNAARTRSSSKNSDTSECESSQQFSDHYLSVMDFFPLGWG